MSHPGAPSPPPLAQALVRLVVAPENRASLEADLAEEFDELAATVGTAAARRWYWKQACLSAPPLIRQRVTTLITSRLMSAAPDRREGRTHMGVLTDLRYAWRMSRRAPVVTISVTLASALGIAASTAIGRLARQLWTESLALFAVAGAIDVALAQPLALWLVSRYHDTLPLAAGGS